MDKDKVPQDDANVLEGKFKMLKYAVDKEGKYTTVHSVGWEPENVALEQAWNEVKENMVAAKKKIESGELSPLAYHMAKNIMDEKLLSRYVSWSARKIKEHLKPDVFNSLKPEVIQAYADVFRIAPEDFSKLD